MKSSANPPDLTTFINELKSNPEKTLSDVLGHSKFIKTDTPEAKLKFRLIKLADELNKDGDLSKKIVDFGIASLPSEIKIPIYMIAGLGAYSKKNNAVSKSMNLYAERLKSRHTLPSQVVDEPFQQAVSWAIFEAIDTVLVAAKDTAAIAIKKAIEASPVLNANHQLNRALLLHAMVPANYCRAAHQAEAVKNAPAVKAPAVKAPTATAPKATAPKATASRSSTAAVVKKFAAAPKTAHTKPAQKHPADFGKTIAANRNAQRKSDFIALAKQPQKVSAKAQGLAKANQNDAIRAQRDKAHQAAARKQAQPKIQVKAGGSVNLSYGGNSPKEVGKAMEADVRQARDQLKHIGKKTERVGKKVGKALGLR